MTNKRCRPEWGKSKPQVLLNTAEGVMVQHGDISIIRQPAGHLIHASLQPISLGGNPWSRKTVDATWVKVAV